MENFASYILEEENLDQKMLITYYLSKKTGIFFDKSIVLKTEIAKLFIEYMNLDIDKNLVLTAMLLCNCKKVDDAQKMGKLETYAIEGAEYLATLGFDTRFCKMCEEVNRYSGSEPREKESDILEVVDQFTGLILNRVEREAFTPEEALIILKERNLKFIDNIYLDLFETFINEMEKITIKEVIDVPVIKKLVNLHNREANVKSFLVAISNSYDEKIRRAIAESKKIAIEEKESLEAEYSNSNKEEDIERLLNKISKAEGNDKSLFTTDTIHKVLNHTSKYKVEE